MDQNRYVPKAETPPVAPHECRVDPHLKVLDERVVRRAKARGLDVLVYAPHFTRLPDIRARARAHSDDDLLVLAAREVFTGSWRNRRHLLALGLSEPIPDFITLAGAVAECRRQGAAILVPHPEFLNVSLDAETIQQYRKSIDAVEVYNPKHWARHDHRARDIASQLSVPAFGSSYAHLRSTVGEVWTTFEDPIEREADLVAALKRGVPRRVFHRGGASHRLRRAAEFAHLGYENGWGKFDRLVLSGMEATHPRHDAYEGRFEGVRVY